jgi:hypothetical protein
LIHKRINGGETIEKIRTNPQTDDRVFRGSFHYCVFDDNCVPDRSTISDGRRHIVSFCTGNNAINGNQDGRKKDYSFHANRG